MKEIKLQLGGVWGCVTAIIIAVTLSGSAIFINMQTNQAQKEIAEIQAQATKEAAGKIGSGTCLSEDGKNRFTCENL